MAFLILDIEIILIYPLGLTGYSNSAYGLGLGLLFISFITIGFVFELGKSALKIDSRQVIVLFNVKSSNVTELISKSNDIAKPSV